MSSHDDSHDKSIDSSNDFATTDPVIRRLVEQQDALYDHVDALEAANERKDEQITELTNELNAVKNQLAEERSARRTLERVVTEVADDVNDLDEQVFELEESHRRDKWERAAGKPTAEMTVTETRAQCLTEKLADLATKRGRGQFSTADVQRYLEAAADMDRCHRQQALRAMERAAEMYPFIEYSDRPDDERGKRIGCQRDALKNAFDA